ncbi:hypothetical protein BC628DRAFT_895488 [Trametes gibbosa]|nr:hypothetical protein BC628DRAFT_895488 [Trametes gibbosa]
MPWEPLKQFAYLVMLSARANASRRLQHFPHTMATSFSNQITERTLTKTSMKTSCAAERGRYSRPLPRPTHLAQLRFTVLRCTRLRMIWRNLKGQAERLSHTTLIVGLGMAYEVNLYP